MAYMTSYEGSLMHTQKATVPPQIGNSEQDEIIKKIKMHGIYQHSKNKQLYQVVALSRSVDDLSWWVVYTCLYENSVSQVWHRRAAMFLEEVELEGVKVPRFLYLRQAEERE
jgi:hypothetical protein